MKTKLTVYLPCEVHAEIEPADGGIRLSAITAVLWPKFVVDAPDAQPMVEVPELVAAVKEALARDDTYGDTFADDRDGSDET